MPRARAGWVARRELLEPNQDRSRKYSMALRLSLAHLTVLDAHPLGLIDAAAAGGFFQVHPALAAARSSHWRHVRHEQQLLHRARGKWACQPVALADRHSQLFEAKQLIVRLDAFGNDQLVQRTSKQ